MTLKRPANAADHRSMATSRSRLSAEHGYTLVELMVAALVLVIGMAGAFAMLNGANRTTVTNNARMGATNLARELAEDARSVDYDKLNPTDMVGALQAKAGFSGAATPWKIQRRGIEYTIATEVCVFDDPKDNVATLPPANVCTPQAPVPVSAGALEPEIQPDDFRRVTVTLTWDTGTGSKSLKQIALVNNPSGGLGPRITRFDPPDLNNQFSTGNVATFPTTTTTAASVRWNTDGTPNGSGDSTGGTTSWTTSWQLGPPAAGIDPPAVGAWPAQYDTATTVLDGTYTATAQAFDDLGIAGDTRAAVLPLNRSAPITVTGFNVGRNFNLNRLEFSWNANPELDILGYEVYDTGPDGIINSNDGLVCSTGSVDATDCISSGWMPATDTSYYVVALDHTDIRTGTGTRRSTYAQRVATTSAEPAQPLLLVVTPDLATGKPRLSWSHPNVSDVRYFRIYRDDCCEVDDRYNITATNATSWVDPNASAGTHRYWVTAVGSTTTSPPGISESRPSNSFDWTML
jgi:prepilin-type N-terminal cleavage/methylation domain-containing protein